jgi:hypothetical protein
LNLLHSFSGKLQLFVWRFLRLFDETVHNDDLFAFQVAVEYPADTIPAFRPHLEQSPAHRPGIGHPDLWAVFDQQLRNSPEIRLDARRPSVDISLDTWMEIFDFIANVES